MRKMLTTMIVLLFVVAAFAQSSIFCDWHNATAFKSGTEYPNGKCYNVYTHPVWENGKRYVHKLSTPCR